MSAQGLVHGPLGDDCLHVCVDMQRLFAPGSPWEVPWLEPVLPAVEKLAFRHAARTVFTRFVPPVRAEEMPGSWQRYYRRWHSVTLEQMDSQFVDLVPALSRFVPPASVVDKRVYSPWTEGNFDRLLSGSGITSIVVTGGETDVCVLATILGAVDGGYRTIVATDAICSSADETHDALMQLYRTRFSEQIEMATVEEILESWRS